LTRGRLKSGPPDLPGVGVFEVERLLGRAPVELGCGRHTAHIRGRVVLVTGAGGTIGSELCRQLGRLHPERLVLLGNEENQLHDTAVDLGLQPAPAPFEVVLGDIRDQARMDQVFRRFRPDLVFHVAAHKHVPLLEANPEEAVKNNILGTRNVALAALRAGTDVFVNVSTDKAADPCCVMGASKWLGEMVVQSLNDLGATRFVVVRFGNILGSRGSVLPLFQKQVARGGPVTVTHPEATRYFMTAKEACRLLILSAAEGGGGQVLILNMGTPVRILDLAENVIRLAGKEPGRDVRIEFVGLRPGERLHEELVSHHEDIPPAPDRAGRGVLRARQPVVPWPVLRPKIEHLARLAARGEGEGVREYLFRLVAAAGSLYAGGDFHAGGRRDAADDSLGQTGYQPAGG